MSRGYVPLEVVLGRRSEGGVGLPSLIVAWAAGALNALHTLRDELQPEQVRLGEQIIEHWGMVLPLMLVDDAIPRLVIASEAAGIRKLFLDADAIAAVVLIARPLLPHAGENEERDARIIAELREFCTRELEAIRGFGGGDFEAERWIFDFLCQHMRNLLQVVLGDRHLSVFAARYDEAMEELKTQATLLQTPPN